MKQVLLILLLIILSTLAVFAQTDDEGNPNDPTVNENANACYNGGAMEGKCDSQWAWECGWYMIRYDYELISREEIPVRCDSLLPADVPPAVRSGGSGGEEIWCYTNGIDSFELVGSINSYDNVLFHKDTTCTDPDLRLSPQTLVTALSYAQAVVLCQSFGYLDAGSFDGYGYNVPQNWYMCFGFLF